MDRIERTISLSGTGGPNVTSIIGEDGLHIRRRIRNVEIRYVSGSHVFTACAVAIGLFPKALVAGGYVLDAAGRPTVAENVFAAVPAERRPWNVASVTPGAASALASFYSTAIADADRGLIIGPWSLSVQWTVSSGTASTFLFSFETESED